MKDGKEYEEYMEYPKGDPREPMTMEDLDNKFNALAKNWLSEEKRKEVKSTIFNCENISSKEFMSKLVV